MAIQVKGAQGLPSTFAPLPVRTHLGDDIFENSHAARQVLLFDTDYRLRVRRWDSSGDPATEWSEWVEGPFHTSSATEVQPLMLADVMMTSSLTWHDTLGNRILLPAAVLPPALRIASSADELILEIRGLDGLSNLVTAPPPLVMHVPIRVDLDAGDTGQDLSLPESQLAFSDATGVDLATSLWTHLGTCSLTSSFSNY